MMRLIDFVFILMATICFGGISSAFVTTKHSHHSSTSRTRSTTLQVNHSPANDDINNNDDDNSDFINNQIDGRRIFFQSTFKTARRLFVATGGSALLIPPRIAHGIDVSSSITAQMKDFVDPQGYFSIRIPTNFYAIRRTVKNEMPNSSKPDYRNRQRGASIFTAGNMAKAEVISIDRFPTKALLEDNGIEAIGSLRTFPDLGEPQAIAYLLSLRGEKKATTNTAIFPDSLKVSRDGKELFFKLKTEIEVQKPELLMEEYGSARLFRLTTAKASLKAEDGSIMVVYASALERDFDGPDGRLLEDAVDSFTVMDREFGF